MPEPVGEEPEPPRLSDVAAAERAHPLFRRGYNLGYACRAQEETLDRLARDGPRNAPESPSMAAFDVTSGGLLGRLSPGDRAARDLAGSTSEHFTTETPCCGRKITMPTLDEDETVPAVCCRCRISYRVSLHQDEPDGYSDSEPSHVAVFTVEHLDVAVGSHRSGR